MTRARTTMKDVAEAAGVSVVTVSRVFNNTYRNKVAESTRQRVLAVAASLNYRPSLMARGLTKRQTQLIGVIVPSLTGSFTSESVQGIQDLCEEENYSLILYTTQQQPKRARAYLRLLWQERRVDGLIVVDPPRYYSDIIAPMIEEGIPVVQLLFDDPSLNTPRVLVNHKMGAIEAVKHLIDLGHRRILHLSSSLPHGSLRREGYVETMTAHGLSSEIRDLEVGHDWTAAFEAVLQYFSTNTTNRPTAIFASSDTAAFGAIKALYHLGLRVPDDASVVGFDDLPFAEMATPSLTTVSQPKYQVGREAAKTLLKLVRQKEAPSLVLDPRLVVRESTARPPSKTRRQGVAPSR